jgi:trypsin-like peptidase
MLLLVPLFFVAPATLKAERVIPDSSLGYPVLITSKSCPPALVPQASGFFLKTSDSLYLVTARHVFFDNSSPAPQLICKQTELVAYSPNPKETGKNRILLDLVALNASGDLKKHATHDVAVVRIGTFTQMDGKEKTDFLPGVQDLESLPSGIVTVSLDSVKKFDQVLAANEIYIFGFPSSIGFPNVPQIDYLKPLIRKGIVAGINERRKTLILDGFVFHGNSGGLVLEVEQPEAQAKKARVIGVISQIIPVVASSLNPNSSHAATEKYNSGYSVAEPMDMVLELVEALEANCAQDPERKGQYNR